MRIAEYRVNHLDTLRRDDLVYALVVFGELGLIFGETATLYPFRIRSSNRATNRKFPLRATATRRRQLRQGCYL